MKLSRGAFALASALALSIVLAILLTLTQSEAKSPPPQSASPSASPEALRAEMQTIIEQKGADSSQVDLLNTQLESKTEQYNAATDSSGTAVEP
jgi:hypothetical protein